MVVDNFLFVLHTCFLESSIFKCVVCENKINFFHGKIAGHIAISGLCLICVVVTKVSFL